MKGRSLILLLMSLTVTVSASAEGWRGIVPLQSTCADVKLALKVDKCVSPMSVYELPAYRVIINFSDKSCANAPLSYRVPIGTVTSISVSPRKKTLPSEYGINLSNYKKSETDLVGMDLYDNPKEGITVYLFNGFVHDIIFYPPLKDERLRCKPHNRSNKLYKLRSLIPIESTAKDVKKLLGEPLKKSPDFYKLDDYNVMVTYSSGLSCDHPCVERGRTAGWAVPRDTVVTVAIIITKAFKLKALQKFGIDLSKYKKQENADHIPETVYYSNDEEGIGIFTNGDQVNSIALFPAKKHFHLMCPLSKDRPVCSK